MAKLTSDEFNNKYNEKIVDNDDLLIELMEDFADSISLDESEELATLKEEIEKVKAEYIDLKEKYKARFLGAVEKEEEVKEEIVDEPQEEEIVDVKEI